MIYQIRDVIDFQCLSHLLLIHFLIFFAVYAEQFSHTEKHRFFYRIRKILFFLLQHIYFGFQIRRTVFQLHQFCPFHTFHKHTKHIFRRFCYLFDHGNGTDLIQIIF